MSYNYYLEVQADVEEYIEENIDFKDFEDIDELRERLNEDLWVEDSVTGNASGSYTFNTYKAEEYLCHNLGLAEEAFREFGYEGVPFDKGAEYIDVTIRCYLLAYCIDEALKNYEDRFEEDEEDEED